MTKKNVLTLISGLALFALLGFFIIKLLPVNIWADTLSEEEVRERISRKYGGEIVELVQQGEHFDVQLLQDTGLYEVTMDAKSGRIITMQQTDSVASLPPDMIPDEDPSDSDLPDNIDPGKTSSEHSNASEMLDDQENSNGFVGSDDDENPNGSAGPNVPSDTNDRNDEQPSDSNNTSDPNDRNNHQPNIDPPNEPNDPSTTEDVESPDSNPAHDDEPEHPENQTPQPPSRITADEAGRIAVNEIGGYVDDIDLEEIGGTIYYIVEVEFDNDENDDDDLEAEVQIDVLTGEIISIVWDD